MPIASESTTVNSVTTTMTTFSAPVTAPRSMPNNQSALAASFTNFLTVSIHQILFLRSVYPRATFLPVRAYNYPVRQSRHPKVCDYINEASISVGTEILKGTITAVSIIISSLRTNQPLERYAFDLSGFPRVPTGEVNTTFEDRREDSSKPGTPVSDRGAPSPPTPDLEAQFRACLARLASACARLTPLPRDEEFSFTVCIEVREDALPPAGTTKEEQTWIVAEPGKVHLRSCTAPYSVSKLRNGEPQQPPPRVSNGRAKTVPVRRVEAGELRLELWVEEARQKFNEPVDSEHPPWTHHHQQWSWLLYFTRFLSFPLFLSRQTVILLNVFFSLPFFFFFFFPARVHFPPLSLISHLYPFLIEICFLSFSFSRSVSNLDLAWPMIEHTWWMRDLRYCRPTEWRNYYKTGSGRFLGLAWHLHRSGSYLSFSSFFLSSLLLFLLLLLFFFSLSSRSFDLPTFSSYD